MRILFVGAVDFSRHCLERVIEAGGQVVGVLTLRREDAGFHSDYADLFPSARRHRIPVHCVRHINAPETVERIRSIAPDVIFVFGWSQLVGPEVLQLPPLGCIGTHPALLPRNRGRHPITWVLADGESETGLSFFYLEDGPDSGDLLWQKSFPLRIDDDAGSVYRKIQDLAGEGIRDFLPKLAEGRAARVPQDPSMATYRRRRNDKDGEIDWAGPTMRTYNLIRALARPYVGAHTFLEGERIAIWKASPPAGVDRRNRPTVDPGTIVAMRDHACDVAAGDGCLTLLEYEAPGGWRLETGQRLGGSH